MHRVNEETYLFDYIHNKIYKSKDPGLNQFLIRRNQVLDIFIYNNEIYSYNVGTKSFVVYPFEINEYAVVFHTERLNCGYTYLLAISRPSYLATWQNPSPTQEDSDLFEDFVASVLMVYLGSNSHALAFGWPSKLGRPQEFHKAVEWLASKMGIEPGSAFRPPRRKDGGVDVVAWKGFGDKRSGFPIYLVQCTLQRDFLSKSRDIDLRLWAGWLEMDRDPLAMLAVPKTISSGELWNEISANAIVFDRIRLTEYSNFNNSSAVETYLKKIVSKWQFEGANHLA
jgi:hypothetical protein